MSYVDPYENLDLDLPLDLIQSPQDAPKVRFSGQDRIHGNRKRKLGESRAGAVTTMWENHHVIAQRILLGESNKSIAQSMGMTEARISLIRNSPVVKEKLELMKAARDVGCIDLARESQDLAPIALARVKEALETGKVNGKELSASGIMKEANTLIDRTIGKPTQTINTRNLHATLTPEAIAEIKERAKQMAAQSGQLGA